MTLYRRKLLLKSRGSVWIDKSFDHLIRSEEDYKAETLYIAMHAVERSKIRGLVESNRHRRGRVCYKACFPD